MISWHIRQIVHRRVQIHPLIHISVKSVIRCIDSAQRQQPVKDARKPKIQIRRMGSSQAAAERQHSRLPVPAVALIRHPAHKRHHLVHNIMDPLLMAPAPPARIPIPVRPGLHIHGINSKYHHLSRINPRGPHIRHLIILKIEKTSVLTGDEQRRAPCMSIHLTLHVPSQCCTVLSEILYFHIFSPFRTNAPNASPRSCPLPLPSPRQLLQNLPIHTKACP